MSDQVQSTFKDILRKNKLSFTKPRYLVLEVLLNTDAISMAEIIDQLKHEIDRASIYRTIGAFESLGVVQRINYGWKHKFELSDQFRDHHHHLICLGCGKTILINETEIEDFIDSMATQNAFSVLSHQLEIQGYCLQCTKVAGNNKALGRS